MAGMFSPGSSPTLRSTRWKHTSLMIAVLAVAAGIGNFAPGFAAGLQQSEELGAAMPQVAADIDTDIDAFMERVLRRRRANLEDMYKYTVRDRESFDVKGPAGITLESQVGEYTWFIRDGYMIRSPDRINGGPVSDAERIAYEESWLSARKREQERRAKKLAERRDAAEADGEESSAESLEREYFLGFRFEPGNYYAAGWEQIDDMRVVRIEYYPTRMFDDEEFDDDADGELDAGERLAESYSRKFEKTSLVTMWVLPEAHQIVKITFDNVGLDYLPLRWLVQLDDIRASMTMHRPFDDDIWLPRLITAYGKATMAAGSFTLDYSLEYHEYKQADAAATVRFRIPEQQ